MAKRPPKPAGRAFDDDGLFQAKTGDDALAPLADRMRPRRLGDIVGQKHLLGEGKLLARAIAEDRVTSMMLWGPPGCGKTTLARVIAESTKARFVPYSAVLGSVADLRVLLAEAKERRAYQREKTLLFIDEIHRFNKSQQDALLPSVERGDIVLIGATTENPSFAINAALLSRSKVFHLESLAASDVTDLMQRALDEGSLRVSAEEDALLALAELAGGDGRRALGLLDAAAAHARSLGDSRLTRSHVAASNEDRPLLYDKSGEQHYDVASAFIKSMRGSDPDASLYWMFRMLDAGEDPLFVSRRMMIFASEDIGNAEPRALAVATDADAAFRRLGMPEGTYPLAHACLFLASVPKSDGVKRAIAAARAAIDAHGSLPVPKKLRNAPTRLMKDDGYGEGYRYAHDHPDHVVPGETYLPDAIANLRIYEPTSQGFEKMIAERLKRLRGE